MTSAAWVSLFSPAVAVVLIALAGHRISGRQAGFLAAGSTFVSFVATVVASLPVFRASEWSCPGMVLGLRLFGASVAR